MPCRGLEGLQTAEIGKPSGHGIFSNGTYEYVKELSFVEALLHHHNKGVRKSVSHSI
jgi:hypothetical protein